MVATDRAPRHSGSAAPAPSSLPAEVLVVEDDHGFAQILRRRLLEEGFGVQVVGDGEAALELLARARFDAVVLDLLLPGVDGFEVCRRIREGRCWVPVVMVTALGGIDDRMQGFELGADDYLVKPFVLEELVARLHVVLRRRHGSADAFLSAGDLRLDLMSRRAFREDVALDLAPKEFDLLELFVRHADIVVTRQTILIAVWGRDAAVSKNVVDQYVAHLRKKIDRPFGRSDLETVYGVGWRLRIPEAR
ncbi:MAG: response regulator transcription factor [Actinomycetota bacterium]|nr:response regulator transcription factor [Actinomycetota bacterium]